MYILQDRVMYNMSGGNKCGLRDCSLQAAKQSRNLRVVFCTIFLLCLLRDGAVDGLYSSLCCVLFLDVSSLLIPRLKGICVPQEWCSPDKLGYLVLWACCYSVKGILSFTATNILHIASKGRVPQLVDCGVRHNSYLPPLLHSPVCVPAFRKNAMASSVENHQPNLSLNLFSIYFQEVINHG